MKKILLVTTLFVAVLNAFTQSLSSELIIVDRHTNDTLYNGDTLHIEAYGSHLELGKATGKLKVSKYGLADSVHLKRYEVSVPSGSDNFFCWGACKASFPSGSKPVWYADGAIPIGSKADTSFGAYYVPNGVYGNAYFRYVWFRNHNENDTVQLIVAYNNPAGINDKFNANSISIYPTPTKDYLNINLKDFSNKSFSYSIYNLLGSETGLKGRVSKQNNQINTSKLKKGVYFVKIEISQGEFIMKKFNKI